MSGISVMVRFKKTDETGSIGRIKIYNYFFIWVKGGWLEPIILNNITNSYELINTLYNKYIEKYKDKLDKIVVITHTYQKEKQLETFLKQLFEFLLQHSNNRVGEAITKLILKYPKKHRYTILQAVDYILSGIIFIDNNILYKKEYMGKYKTIEDFLQSTKINSVTPVMTEEGIYLYYPGMKKLVKITDYNLYGPISHETLRREVSESHLLKPNY